MKIAVKRGDANPSVEVPVVTGMGEARNIVLVKSAASTVLRRED